MSTFLPAWAPVWLKALHPLALVAGAGAVGTATYLVVARPKKKKKKKALRPPERVGIEAKAELLSNLVAQDPLLAAPPPPDPPVPFTGPAALGYFDKVFRGYKVDAGYISPRPTTKTSYLTSELLKKARSAAIHEGNWALLAEAIRVAVIAASAQGWRAPDLPTANHWVDFAKHVLFSNAWSTGMTEAEVRAQAYRAIRAIYLGGIDPVPPPDVLTRGDGDPCHVEVPVMREEYGKLFEKRGEDWGQGCVSRMTRLRSTWEWLMQRGGTRKASMSDIRYAFAEMARQRAGASWSNTSASAAPLPGDLRAFIVGIGAIAGPGWGGVLADQMLKEAGS